MNPLAGTPVEETTLETERLLLEPLLPEHAALLFEDLADERLYRFMPTDAPESAEALESRYRKLSSRRSPDGSQVWLNFAMRLREGTTPEVEVVRQATYVGTLEATVYPDRSAYIAYSVFVPFWRQGYAREGCAHAEAPPRRLQSAGRCGRDGHAQRRFGRAGGVFGLRAGRHYIGS
jgi:RimJ/RimL family protein N-acetyltransferase